MSYAMLNGGELARLKTVNGNTVLVGADGTTLATFDANNNLIANVNLRTDTLANLLALAGGVSEIGYDPATKTLVMFNGVAGQAVASGRSRGIAGACAGITATATSATPTTYTPIPWDMATVMYDDDIFISGTPEKLLVPAGANAVRVRGGFSFSAGAGLTRQFRLEGSSDGTTFTTLGADAGFPSDGPNIAYGNIDFVAPLLGTETHVRLAAANAGSVSLTVTKQPNSLAVIEFLAA